jgi:hypothetical protein
MPPLGKECRLLENSWGQFTDTYATGQRHGRTQVFPASAFSMRNTFGNKDQGAVTAA